MKTLLFHYFFPISCFAALAGCYATNELSENGSGDSGSDVELADPSRSLADYLRGVNGVTVSEAGGEVSITVQGSLSFHNDTSPLFVVDGVRYGHSYAAVERSVPVQTIQSVRVLKGSEASSAYGMAGSNGVIVIRTKRR